jgi:hypothetical protein
MPKKRSGKEQDNIDGPAVGGKLRIRLNLNLDMGKVTRWRDSLFTSGKTAGYTDIVLLILNDALKKEPALASLGEDEITAAEEIDIDITV